MHWLTPLSWSRLTEFVASSSSTTSPWPSILASIRGVKQGPSCVESIAEMSLYSSWQGHNKYYIYCTEGIHSDSKLLNTSEGCCTHTKVLTTPCTEWAKHTCLGTWAKHSHGGRAPEVTEATRNLCTCHSNTYKQLFRSYTDLRQIYNCQMGNKASKCALWGGHHQCMYAHVHVCMYVVCRKCVTLKNAIIVRPTHTLRVESPGILYAKCAHVFVTVLVDMKDAEPELEGDGAIEQGD